MINKLIANRACRLGFKPVLQAGLVKVVSAFQFGDLVRVFELIHADSAFSLNLYLLGHCSE